jgi:hypothetical protein
MSLFASKHFQARHMRLYVRIGEGLAVGANVGDVLSRWHLDAPGELARPVHMTEL